MRYNCRVGYIINIASVMILQYLSSHIITSSCGAIDINGGWRKSRPLLLFFVDKYVLNPFSVHFNSRGPLTCVADTGELATSFGDSRFEDVNKLIVLSFNSTSSNSRISFSCFFENPTCAIAKMSIEITTLLFKYFCVWLGVTINCKSFL